MASFSSLDDQIDLIECVIFAHPDNAIGRHQVVEIVDKIAGISEAATSYAIARMTRRAQLLGPSYPIEILQGAFRRRENWEHSTYLALLSICSSTVLSSQEFGQAIPASDVLLEQITELAIKSWLGSGSESIRFGWPSDCGRPSDFADAVRWLAELMMVQLGSAYLPPLNKDGGVDVVGWRHFPDRRAGFPIVLVQCTLQEDLQKKASDIDLRNWSVWLTLDSDPILALATPRMIPDGTDMWKRISRRAIIFERIRLAQSVAELSNLSNKSEYLKASATQRRTLCEKFGL